jgi:hypothetical protein
MTTERKAPAVKDVETRVLTLETDFAGMRSDQRTILANLSELKDSIAAIQRDNKIPWLPIIGSMISAAGFISTVLFVLIGALAQGPMSDLSELKDLSKEQASVLDRNYKDVGQLQTRVSYTEQILKDRANEIEAIPHILSTIEDLRVKDLHLDESLQREMRLLDDALAERISALDESLQREMDLKDKIIYERLHGLITTISSLLDDHKDIE